MISSQSGDHLENNLAKFGYMLDMVVGKINKILSYSWLPTGTYYINMAIWNFFSLKCGIFGPFFFHKKSLV